MRSAVVIDAVRTPIGRAHPEKGIYRDVRADELSADLMVALGRRVEHMHHIPMEAGFNPNPHFFYRHSPATLNMGLTAENLARKYKIGRREQDEFALRSHQRAADAAGLFAREIIPTWGRDDEGRR